MILNVHVKPGSKVEKIEEADDGNLIVRVKEKPEDGKANEAVIRVLAKKFGIPKSGVRILTPTARRKRIEINLE